MSSASKIAKILVRSVNSNGEIEEKKRSIESFWKDEESSGCVIIFFRRFGCHLCRLTAKEMSENVKPILDKNKIRLIGIGFDTRFVKPFCEEGYFKGELYLDSDLECYKALEFKRYSSFELFRALGTTKWIDIWKQLTNRGVKGNFTEGDGFQSGGALIVDKNGKQLLEFRQNDVSDLITSDQILKALNLNKE